jgi:hypothetical protein
MHHTRDTKTATPLALALGVHAFAVRGADVKKVLLCLVLFAACDPDVERSPAPSGEIHPLFDPAASVVPTPNDLAKSPTTGKIVVPDKPTDSAAQREFNKSYLELLDGFPHESTAKVGISGALAPESVNPMTVIGFDITGLPAPVVLAPRLAGQDIVIAPPAGGWLRGHRYAIALLGGPNGLRGATGEEVIGSATWALVSSPKSLVTCEDLASPDCLSAVDVIPSAEGDPTARAKDQAASAIQLEQIRRGYAPLLDALEARGVPRANVPVLWTFSIIDAGEMTFDPANNVVPFPNDVLRQGGKVALPNPATGAPLTAAECAAATEPQLQLTCGLNTLDGFSTLAPLISETSNERGAVMQANIDPTSLNARSVGLVPLASEAPAAERTPPKYVPCLNCTSSDDAAGAPQTSPQQLQWRLEAPLDEKTTYFAFVTTDVKDDKGKPVIPNPVFALVRSAAPLVENDKSAVDILGDAQAKQLEPLRAALAPAFDGLEKQGITRASLALAFPFTTQSEASVLDQLHAYPAAVPGLPDTPLAVTDATAQYTTAAGNAGIPLDGVGKIFAGVLLTPVAVTGPGGTLDVNAPKPLPVAFAIAVPATPAPPGGYPVTIFGHGFTRSRNDFLPLASALAKAGQAVIATDVLFHGDRTSCTGSKAATSQSSDDASCAAPATMKCDEGAPLGLCVLRDDGARAACKPGPQGDGACTTQGQGRCAADSKCQGAGAELARDASGRPLISGWNIFSLTNLFATRDNLRQQVIDLAQLVRVVKSASATSLSAQLGAANGGAVALDKTKLGYVGQSLGGILGTLFNAVSPDTTNVALNVPGGALPQIILTAPSFAAQKTALLGQLSAQGITPGSPQFDTFLSTVQWVLDPADPANMGYRLTHPVDLGGGAMAPNANRKAFIQFIEGDQTVPNVSNLALVRAANRAFVAMPPSFGCTAPLLCYQFTESGDAFDANSATLATRHGFLLSPPQGAKGTALTVKAQTQVATFLATGTLP